MINWFSLSYFLRMWIAFMRLMSNVIIVTTKSGFSAADCSLHCGINLLTFELHLSINWILLLYIGFIYNK